MRYHAKPRALIRGADLGIVTLNVIQAHGDCSLFRVADLRDETPVITSQRLVVGSAMERVCQMVPCRTSDDPSSGNSDMAYKKGAPTT